MLVFLLSFAISLQVYAEGPVNPYSNYGSGTYLQGYAGYSIPTSDSGAVQVCTDANWDSDCQCERQKKKIELAKKEGQTLAQFDWSQIQSKKLTIIGDAHGVTSPDAVLNLIQRSRAKTGKHCVFFEMTSDFSQSQFLKLLRERSGNPDTDRLRRHYSAIANGAVFNGSKLYMVDSPKNWTGDRNVSDIERELHMTEKMKSAFSSGKCAHAAFVVGKDHVNNLSELISAAGLSSTRLNPIHSSNAGRNGPQEEWNGICTTQMFTPSEGLIFSNSEIKNDLIYPGFIPPNSTMTYGGFDYSILFPGPRFEEQGRSEMKTNTGRSSTGTR